MNLGQLLSALLLRLVNLMLHLLLLELCVQLLLLVVCTQCRGCAKVVQQAAPVSQLNRPAACQRMQALRCLCHQLACKVHTTEKPC